MTHDVYNSFLFTHKSVSKETWLATFSFRIDQGPHGEARQVTIAQLILCRMRKEVLTCYCQFLQ